MGALPTAGEETCTKTFIALTVFTEQAVYFALNRNSLYKIIIPVDSAL